MPVRLRTGAGVPEATPLFIGTGSVMFSIGQVAVVVLVAGVVTYCMVPVSKRIACVLGAIDYPSNRRVNVEPVPRCGGIALYVGFLAGCFTVWVGIRFFNWGADELYTMRDIDFRLLFFGMTLMFCVGLVDDIVQLSAPVKLAGQIVAAFVVVLSGVTIGAVRMMGDQYIELTWLDVPLTVLYLVIFVNVINLIDGLDGLAAGVTAIAALGFLYLVTLRGSFLLAMACIALVAVCLAFLRFNFSPASVFMGDSGALLLGLILGVISVTGVVRAQSIMVMLVPFVIAGVPVLDTLSSILRRTQEHRPIGQPDLGHIHHRIVRFGFSQKRAVLILYACSAALVLFGCLLGGASGRVRWILLIVLLVVGVVAVWALGLAHPVLRHHYDNLGKRGERKPVEPSAEDGGAAGDAVAAGEADAAGDAEGGAR